VPERSKPATRTDWFLILGFLIPVFLVAVTSVLLPWLARWTNIVVIGSAALVVLILGAVLVVVFLSAPEDRRLRVAVLLFSLPLPLYVIGGVLPASRRHYDLLSSRGRTNRSGSARIERTSIRTVGCGCKTGDRKVHTGIEDSVTKDQQESLQGLAGNFGTLGCYSVMSRRLCGAAASTHPSCACGQRTRLILHRYVRNQSNLAD